MFVGWLVRNWRRFASSVVIIMVGNKGGINGNGVYYKYLNSHLEDVRRILQTIENSGGTRQTNTN